MAFLDIYFQEFIAAIDFPSSKYSLDNFWHFEK